jgi:hypothetical protein
MIAETVKLHPELAKPEKLSIFFSNFVMYSDVEKLLYVDALSGTSIGKICSEICLGE